MWGFVKLHGALSKGKVLGGRGDPQSQGLLGSHIRGLHWPVDDSEGCSPERGLHERPDKSETKAATLRSSLAKLPTLLNNRSYFSGFWKLGSSRSRCHQTWCLVRTTFFIDSNLLAVTSNGRSGAGRQALWDLLSRHHLFHGGSTAMSQGPQKGALITPAHWVLGSNTQILGKHKYSVRSTLHEAAWKYLNHEGIFRFLKHLRFGAFSVPL